MTITPVKHVKLDFGISIQEEKKGIVISRDGEYVFIPYDSVSDVIKVLEDWRLEI